MLSLAGDYGWRYNLAEDKRDICTLASTQRSESGQVDLRAFTARARKSEEQVQADSTDIDGRGCFAAP